jgi:iron uptake system component EfeO
MRKGLFTGAVALILAALLGGCGSSGAEEPSEAVRLGAYRAYLRENTASLVRAIQAMQPELERNQVSRAQSRFARARVRYSQVAPGAEEFPQLDARINGLPGEDPADRLSGFRRIERELWKSGDTAGMAPVGKQLIADTEKLGEHLVEANFTAVQLAAASERILSRISTLKLSDKEDAYSGLALVDVSANLEAVGAELAALEPALTQAEQAQLRRLLNKAYAAIAQYGTPARDPNQPRGRSPGAIFVIFEELSPAEIEELDQPVRVLRNAFSKVHSRLREAATG